ncbi:YdeI/OmpD-associated family protein [Jeotgalibaca sp. MA1X17-3]|uniref:YdeI/OmpD-associated family protein n=1 Tax=Jeotgalibaca sp. MA1X17-3 TaxID=2908211 RepID=UPI001F1C4A2A|nr:YdeI/OmpD-associated family protein [Jeotgalibaca sp. MA1X17-3]UJF16593.1 YdeI/OmpD-associated family protein [Jeotgalibaca sp. MA1X17-3]
MTLIFDSKLLKIESFLLIKVPLDISKELSSRGLVMVKGTINDVDFKKTLEPDGKGSHWLEVDPLLYEKIGVEIGETISLRIEQTNEWIEPKVPEDMIHAIAQADVEDQWRSITVRSRWEWIRWVRSTKNINTRNKRIEVACSKLQKGDKNPCCFDASRCTVTEVSKSGVLVD